MALAGVVARDEPDGDGGGRTSAVFNRNRLKLGVFAMNLDHGEALTTVPEHWHLDWQSTCTVAQAADRAGIEALVPVARWHGFGGQINFGGVSYETYSWAAGLAAVTRHVAIFSTSHVPTVHPVFAAKQGTTIDHISSGRFGLNVVCGWYAGDLNQFGVTALDHDTLYAYGEEWLHIVRRLWTTTDEFDYDGRFFHIKGVVQHPKPLQRPRPVVMNAGTSEVGKRFAARHCDLALISLGQMRELRPAGHWLPPRPEDYEAARERVASMRRLAREEFGRELQIWSRAFVVCRATEKEARDYVRHYVYDHGDWEAATNRVKLPEGATPEMAYALRSNFIAGAGGFPLVGTAEQIASALVDLVDRVGIDGLLVTWLDYLHEVPQFIAEVMPLLEQAGLRHPFAPGPTGRADHRVPT